MALFIRVFISLQQRERHSARGAFLLDRKAHAEVSVLGTPHTPKLGVVGLMMPKKF